MLDEKTDLVPQTEETQPEETQPVEASEIEETSEEVAEEKKTEDGEEKHKENRLQKRISSLTRKRYEAESRAAAAEARAELLERMVQGGAQQPVNQNSKPARELFASEEDYFEALTDWKVDQKLSGVEQRLTQRQSQEQGVTWEDKIVTAQKEYPDFDEAFDDLQELKLKVANEVNQSIMSSEYGAEIIRHLGQNPEEARKLAKMIPEDAKRYLGRIEAKIESSKSKKPVPTTKAPKPVSPVGVGEGVKPKRNHLEHPEDYSADEWRAVERERKEKLNKR